MIEPKCEPVPNYPSGMSDAYLWFNGNNRSQFGGGRELSPFFYENRDLSWGEIFGNKPGDIFTIGFSGGYILGAGFSFDRIVMPSGEADWYFTVGGGLIAPGATVSIDRGKIFRFDPFVGEKAWNYDFTKSDIRGFSVSGSVDLVVVGGEGAIAPFAYRPPGYPSPLVTGKGGLRIGTPGASLFGNWTIDIGN